MRQEKKVILLAGPTASGKSKLAIKLARSFNGEIINADSMQIYKEISLLTSKPDLKDTKMVKHHLYGFVSVKKNFSTGDWLNAVIKKIEDQWRRGKTPIVVGGTGLYFKALTDGLVKIPNIPYKVRKDARKLHKKIGQTNFFKQLTKLDPVAAKFISPQDKQRSMRAYEVKSFTKKSLFDFRKETKSNFNNRVFKKLFIDIPREILNIKIEKRVEKMFVNNVVSEVKKFYKMKVNRELSSNKIIGMKEIKQYLNDSITLIRTKELIIQKTRQYAKRQFTWSRGHMKSWAKIYSPNINDLFNKAINKIS